MAFAPVFPRVFSETFRVGLATSAAAAWYLSGGIAAANCLAAYTPKGAASLAASYDNNAAPGNGLADGTYDAAPGTAPSFASATGWTFLTASSQYLTTGGLIPATGYSYIARFANRLSAGSLLGSFDGTDNVTMYIDASNLYYGNGGLGTPTSTPALSAGTMAISNSTTYRNGVLDTPVCSAWVASPGITIWLGARNYTGNKFFSSVDILAVAIYDTALTAAQVLAVHTSIMSL